MRELSRLTETQQPRSKEETYILDKNILMLRVSSDLETRKASGKLFLKNRRENKVRELDEALTDIK